MKTRNGFVSNSSSSSFVVGFHKIPTSPENLEIMMFGEPCELNYYDISVTPSITIANRVYSDIMDQKDKRITKSAAKKLLLTGGFPGQPAYNYNEDQESDKIRNAYREETGKDIYDDCVDKKIRKLYDIAQDKERDLEREKQSIAAKAFIEGFWPSLKGKKVFKFEYADDGGEGIFEHGNIFRKFPHFRISHH